MELLKNVEAATHHDDQRAADLCFDGQKTAKSAAKDAENRGGQQRKEPVALVPTVGTGRQLKSTCDELPKQD